MVVEILMRCPRCGADVKLEICGGQYFNQYDGTCTNGHPWSLIDHSANDDGE
jgi:hypothetical protein